MTKDIPRAPRPTNRQTYQPPLYQPPRPSGYQPPLYEPRELKPRNPILQWFIDLINPLGPLVRERRKRLQAKQNPQQKRRRF